VLTGTTVQEVSADGDGYRVGTDQGTWRTRHVVIATGPHGKPHVPAALVHTPVLTSNRYRRPAQLAPGGVLVVGASASGVQIADELSRAGRDVTVAVGRHTRMPRRYRGLDTFWWLEKTGRLARTIDTTDDPVVARGEPSLQLVGHNDAERYSQDLDLATLQSRGVRLVGRVREVHGHTVRLGDNLPASVAAADHKLHHFLNAVDEYVDRVGLTREVWAGARPRPVDLSATPDRLDLRAEGIGTVLVAAGYRPDHPWLRLPITAPDGSIRQQRGVTPAPGVYVVGQRFQHRRDSGFIDGARHDARAVVDHLLTGSHAETLATSEEAA
jgi:putative flavoprotein involved in K+ transport